MNDMTRNIILWLVIAGVLYVVAQSINPQPSPDVVAYSSFVQMADQGLRAYSAICTHLGCVVAYNDLAGVIQCPCHDGRFNPVSGAVVSGPPPAPLSPITVSVEDQWRQLHCC